MSRPAPLPDLPTFVAALSGANIDVEKLFADEKGTIYDPSTGPDVKGPPLPVLTGPEGDIIVKDVLSTGGMGQVMRAEQHSIGRDVAVKVAAPGKRGTLAQAELVVEARVAGQLEHPNIIPVHQLGLTAEGKPIIVMKRIDGCSWKELLHSASASGRDLGRDLDILADVCRALHFAHARGVVHRDVKPANVMVGSFGEVYLVDWGIAVGYGDKPLPDLPHASIVTTVAGTPKYMAPEMALPASGHIDQRTDVYLVGAVLHELITGAPPHTGATMQEVLFAAHTCAAHAYPDDAPAELVAICKKAMQREPAQRFQSAEEVRIAIVGFQSHAEARALCETAEQRLAQLYALSDDADADADAAHADAAADAQRFFIEARFGFSQALRTWPESERAAEGLAHVVTAMAMRELRAGRYDSAHMLAAELATVPANLAQELDQARTKQASAQANVQKLERFAFERDHRIGSPERARVVFVCGLIWLCTQTALQLLATGGHFRAGSGAFAICLALIGALIAFAGIAFPNIRTTSAARSLFLTMLIADLAIGATFFVGWLLDMPPAPILALAHILLAAVIATLAAQDGRLWLSTALATCAVVPVLLFSSQEVYVVSGVGAFLALAAWAKRWHDVR